MSLLFTVFSRLNAGGVYLKLDLVDPAYIRTRRLFGARRLFIKCIFQYWKFIAPRTKIQQKTFEKCETMSSTLSHLGESGKLLSAIELFSTLRFFSTLRLRFSVNETRRKCIVNCSTANVLCKQF